MQLCGHHNASLQNVLSSCKTALTQGHYGWRHNWVLCKLAEVIEARRLEVNRASPATSHGLIQFVRQEGEAISNTTKQWFLLSAGGNWELRADLDSQLKFPQQIAITFLWPDIVLWSNTTRTVIMAELTVPWEDGLKSAFERKKEKYAELAAACIEAGWRSFIYTVEVGCRGFTGTSTQRLVKSWQRRQSKGASGSGFGERTRCGEEKDPKAPFTLQAILSDKATRSHSFQWRAGNFRCWRLDGACPATRQSSESFMQMKSDFQERQ